MTRPARSRRALLVLPAFAAWFLASCSGVKSPLRLPNQPPTVRFTLAPVSADVNDPVFYAYRVFWAGDDPDGRIDHYDYAIDPGPKDTAWVSTTHNEETLFFRSTTPEGNGGPLPRAHDYHVLVLRAVDNQGAMSARKVRAFYSYTVAPTVEIVAPHPSGLLEVQVPPTLSMTWQGTDPDGQVDTRPVRYRFRMMPYNPASDAWMLSRSDSLYDRERASGFAGWDSCGGDTTTTRITNLTPKNHYLFLVVAIDEAGALSPVLSDDENMLRIECNPAATLGPSIHVFNSYLDFTYDSGGYSTDELRWIKLQAPADHPLPFNWEAFASAGANIERYRWGVDLASVADDTPRSDEVHDYFHWSRGGPLEQSCTLVGLPPGQHFLYIEAKDNNGYASLGIVAFKLVVATFNQDLLVVDDTRLEVDRVLNGTLDTYKDVWPSATELDTFLFARGGVPWRGTQNPASGATSVPGVFAGYAFDTLGTRLHLEVPSNGVTLETLGHYRHVVWIVDPKRGASPGTEAFPISVLRYMCDRGRASSLAAYVQTGGRVWLMGGAAATASIAAFPDFAGNDTPSGPVWTNSDRELVQGRLMYDAAHWQSGFANSIAQATLSRSERADEIAASPWAHDDRWTGGVVTAPDYRRLPQEIQQRDPASDPLPPTRTPRQSSSYYPSVFACEYLVVPNVVTEDVDLSPTSVRIASTLDTLYDASSLLLIRSPAPIMTYYHGAEANRFVFTGFAPWLFRRDDCVALTDFVLHDIWGLTRGSAARLEPPGGTAGTTGAPPRGKGVTRAGLRR